MKVFRLLFACCALLCLLLITATAPASAQVLYENGPIDGQDLGWTINFGFAIGDSFYIANSNSTITGLSFGAWMTPGDTLLSAEVSITQYALNYWGGTVYFDRQVDFTQTGCFLNNSGYQVCTETANFNGPTMATGTYFVNLQNAISADGDPIYWDQNNGVGCHSEGCPSIGSVGIGTLPSESFSILGNSSGTGTTPEPGGLILFATGALSTAIFLRRKLS